MVSTPNNPEDNPAHLKHAHLDALRFGLSNNEWLRLRISEQYPDDFTPFNENRRLRFVQAGEYSLRASKSIDPEERNSNSNDAPLLLPTSPSPSASLASFEVSVGQLEGSLRPGQLPDLDTEDLILELMAIGQKIGEKSAADTFKQERAALHPLCDRAIATLNGFSSQLRINDPSHDAMDNIYLSFCKLFYSSKEPFALQAPPELKEFLNAVYQKKVCSFPNPKTRFALERWFETATAGIPVKITRGEDEN